MSITVSFQSSPRNPINDRTIRDRSPDNDLINKSPFNGIKRSVRFPVVVEQGNAKVVVRQLDDC
jgi:hypothetical protein